MADWVWVLGIFVLYFAVLIGIAVVRARQMEDMGDFALGGRKLGSLTAALSAASSSASGWTMLVFPALAFVGGLMHLWTAAGIVLGAWLCWLVMAKRLRRYTIAAGNALTIPEFLETRFEDKSGALRSVAALISLYFITLYVCSGLIAGAKLLDSLFGGLSHDVSVIITLVAVVSYTFIGGFLAVSRTDVFQSLVMLAGFAIMPVALLFIAGNPLGEFEGAPAGFWNPFTTVDGEALGLFTYISALGWGLGSFGSLRVLARFMALEDERRIPSATAMSVGWSLVMFSLGLALGLIAAPALLAEGVPLPDAERLYLETAEIFFHPAVAGVLLCAVVAAIMSTADSQLLIASTVATDDAPLLRRITQELRTHTRVWLGRLLLIAVGVLAAVISIASPESVFALVSLAWGGMGAAFGPALILALYWRRFNRWGAIASVITGTLVSTFWWLMALGSNLLKDLLDLGQWLGVEGVAESLGEVGVWELNPAAPGFLFAFAAAYVVTRLTAPPSPEMEAMFDAVASPDWREEAARG